MAKSEKVFDMLRYIVEQPDELTAADLSKMCGISERGIYRYLNTVARAGIPVRFNNKAGGYVLEDKFWEKFLKENRDDRVSVEALVVAGMNASNNDKLWECGKRILELLKRSDSSFSMGKYGT